MKTITDHLRHHLLQGTAAYTGLTKPKPDLDSLRLTEWSPEFERLMRNRLIMGAIRYGLLSDPKKTANYPLVYRAQILLADYQNTGNLELLVDAANFLLLEFVQGKHPNRHWTALDSGDANPYHHLH